MTGIRSQLMKFVSKFMGTVRFGNDHIARIIGYGDYQLGNVTILRVYYVKSHRLRAGYGTVGYHISTLILLACKLKTILHEAFLDSNFRKIIYVQDATVRNVRTDSETEFVNQTLSEVYENVGISDQTSVARTPQQNDVVERQNWTLVEVARIIVLIILEDPDLSFQQVVSDLGEKL
nr:integrase, catalytic region, zinc finger, CCHC-type, peptidase aspartic, catalytic [Tanacetum cinerariifolium]